MPILEPIRSGLTNLYPNIYDEIIDLIEPIIDNDKGLRVWKNDINEICISRKELKQPLLIISPDYCIRLFCEPNDISLALRVNAKPDNNSHLQTRLNFKDNISLIADALNYILQKNLPKLEVQTNKAMQKNIILYGPPGTGKTFNTVNYALSAIENSSIHELEMQERKNIEITTEEKIKAEIRLKLTKRFNQYKDAGQICFITFHQSYGYEEFVEGLKPVLADEKKESYADNNSEERSENHSKQFNAVKYHIKPGPFRTMCDRASEDPNNNYVLIIDEINRGNISKIFGELITLIEPDKRKGQTNALSVTLPYSQEPFSVAENLYIFGTMNTADRSLAQLDIALRRRFDFMEMMPDAQVLADLNIEGIEIAAMLSQINQHIEALYDREHTIGHAYFTELKGLPEDQQFNKLKYIFRNRIVPLLQEYFFDDWEKISWVLGGDFVTQRTFNANLLPPEAQAQIKTTYAIAEAAFDNPESYQQIYTRKRSYE